MRSTVLLLAGFVLLGVGVSVFALSVPGGTVLGAALIAIGVALKIGGLLAGDAGSADARPGRRAAQTLAGRTVERPRAGIPVARVAVRHRAPRGVPGAVVRPLARRSSDRPADRDDTPARGHRRAS